MNTVTLHITGLDPDGKKVAQLVDGGFDDALITQDRVGDRGVIELDVDEPITDDLLRQLVARVEDCAGVHVEAVGPSPVLNAAEIAERIGRTRQSVTQLASGARGPGGWPHPINPGTGSPLWEWGRVARWLNANIECNISQSEIDLADTISWFNSLLRIATTEHVPEGDEPLRDQARAAVHG